MIPKLLTEKQVHEWLGLSPATLKTMRARPQRDPIPYIKVGRLVRYREDQLVHWLDRHTVDSGPPGKRLRLVPR